MQRVTAGCVSQVLNPVIELDSSSLTVKTTLSFPSFFIVGLDSDRIFAWINNECLNIILDTASKMTGREVRETMYR